jgi:ribose transport system permease protein
MTITESTAAPATSSIEPLEAKPARTQGRTAIRVLERYALLGLVVLIAAFFTVYPDSAETFPTAANLRILTANQTITLLLGLALLFPLVAGHFDFSVGAIAATGSVITAGLMQDYKAPLVVCILASIVAGAILGAINGIAVSKLGMNSFVTTLALATLLGGVIQWYTDGQAISNNISPSLTAFGSGTWLGIPRPVFVVALVVALCWYGLTHTPFGRSLYAIGDNARAARLVGMPIARYTLKAFIFSGTLAGVAGVILTARTGGATADNGTTMLFPALAAVFLGATAIQPGRFNVWGTVVGVALVAISVSGLTLAGASNWVNPVFNGLALAVAVGLSSYLARHSGGRVE